MKNLFFIAAFLLPVVSFGQLLDGDLITEGRKMVSVTNFVVEDIHEGVLFYELAVNRVGKVTSARLLLDGTTVTSTPARIKAYKYLMGLQFQKGTHYPEFHHVRVKVTLKAPVPVVAPN